MILKLLFILLPTIKSLINKITRSVDSQKLQLDLQVTKYSSYTSNEVVSHALTEFKSKMVQAWYCKVHILKSLITAVMNSFNQKSRLAQTCSYRARCYYSTYTTDIRCQKTSRKLIIHHFKFIFRKT